jgi:hypothetical protein
MNNPLAQKAQYYLNESHRLSEELKNEETYSELLENVLFELLGEEQFAQLIEYVMQGDLVTGKDGKPLTTQQSDRRAKRLKQIIDIGVKANKNRDYNLVNRAAHSILAKGGGRNKDLPPEHTGRTHFDAVKLAIDAKSSKLAPLGTNPHATIEFGQQQDLSDIGRTIYRSGSDDEQKKLSVARREAKRIVKNKF